MRSLKALIIALVFVVLTSQGLGCSKQADGNPSYIIELDLIAELQESPGNIEFSVSMGSAPPRILRDRRGQFYITPLGGHRIAVYDSMGAYLHSLGGAGHGPGELGRRPNPVLCDAEGRIWVWEFMSRKVTIYNSEGDFVDSVMLPLSPLCQLKDGSLLAIESATQLWGYSGYPLQRFTVTGELLSSFGNVIPGYQWEQMYLYQMTGALNRAGLFWMTPVGRYGFELWNPLNEQQLKTLPVEVPWFKESIEVLGDYRAVEPTDLITDLSVDENDVIWALISTAAADWKPTKDRTDFSEIPEPGEERRMFFDWIVQAIDPDSGIVLAEHRFSDDVWMLIGSTGLITAESDEETGNARFSIWRPLLVEAPDS